VDERRQGLDGASMAHPLVPPAAFVERMKQFNERDLRGVMEAATGMFRPYLGNLEGERRLIFTDLQQASRQNASLDQCINALWRILPFLKPSDSGRGSITGNQVWVFLVDQACGLGHIDSDDLLRWRAQHRRMNRGRLTRRRWFRWPPWRRRRSSGQKESDCAEDIGDIAGDFVASHGSRSSGSSSRWWDNLFGGSNSGGSGGGGSFWDNFNPFD